MRRRVGAVLVIGALFGGVLAAPAVAQDDGGLLDAPRLGFGVDPTMGDVGDLAEAQVDSVDVVAHCVTDSDELIEQLVGFATEGHSLYMDPGPQLRAVLDRGPLAGVVVPDEWPYDWFSGGPAEPPEGADPLYWTWHLSLVVFPELRGGLEGLAALLLASFLQGAAGGQISSPQIQDAYLDGSFILTFVDPVTQELVGELSNFDAASGEGAIVVPDLEAGLWAVAGACIEPDEPTDESFNAAIQAGTAVLEHYDVPVDANYINFVPEGEEGGQGWLWENVVPPMLAEIVVPRALGIDFFCILNEAGFCATPPDPVGLLEELSDEELAELADLETTDMTADDESGVEAVTASPAFTG